MLSCFCLSISQIPIQLYVCRISFCSFLFFRIGSCIFRMLIVTTYYITLCCPKWTSLCPAYPVIFLANLNILLEHFSSLWAWRAFGTIGNWRFICSIVIVPLSGVICMSHGGVIFSTDAITGASHPSIIVVWGSWRISWISWKDFTVKRRDHHIYRFLLHVSYLRDLVLGVTSVFLAKLLESWVFFLLDWCNLSFPIKRAKESRAYFTSLLFQEMERNLIEK